MEHFKTRGNLALRFILLLLVCAVYKLLYVHDVLSPMMSPSAFQLGMVHDTETVQGYLRNGKDTVRVYDMRQPAQVGEDMSNHFTAIQRRNITYEYRKESLAYLSQKYVSLLKANNRPSYQRIGKEFESSVEHPSGMYKYFFPDNLKFYNEWRMYTFNSSTLDRRNRVITTDNDGILSMVYSEGCSPENLLSNEKAAAELKKYHLSRVKPEVVDGKEQEIIVFSGDKIWGSGFWHYMTEQLPRLPSLWDNGVLGDDDDISKYKFHVEAEGLRKWVSFFTGAQPNQLISGPIYTPSTFHVGSVPTCGQIYAPDLAMLREKALKKIGLLEKGEVKLKGKQRSIIYVERRKASRPLYIDQFRDSLERIAIQNSLTLEVYTDTNLLPLEDTVTLFSSAKVVIGPHGAGLFNTFVSPRDLCLVEILPDFHDTNICYFSMAMRHGVQGYAGFAYNNKQEMYNPVSEVSKAIEKCLALP